MRILKEGDRKKLDPLYIFRCYACGCEWEANRSECVVEDCYMYDEIVCECPTCNTKIAGKKLRRNK